jgi:hypothetical protein
MEEPYESHARLTLGTPKSLGPIIYILSTLP